MIREVDLVSYLPPFLAEYREIRAALEAEDPEFVLAWKAADRVLKNEFIATADEFGIARFEQILNIHPLKEESLESRRMRVQSRWFTTLPYTWRMFLRKLSLICGENGFQVYPPEENGYEIMVCIWLDIYEGPHLKEVKRILEDFLPVNMILLLCGECGARYETDVNGKNRITFVSCFYPRFNLEALKLDRQWKLDGGRKLSGYNSDHRMDLYPLRMEIQTEVSGTPKETARLSVTGSANDTVQHRETAYIRAMADCQGTSGEAVKIKTLAAVRAEAGNVTICNKKYLDGGFRLNGKQKLNGGRESR